VHWGFGDCALYKSIRFTYLLTYIRQCRPLVVLSSHIDGITYDIDITVMVRAGPSIHVQQVFLQVENGFFKITNERPRLHVASG